MPDIATLALKIDSSQAASATKVMDQMASSAQKVEAATSKLASTTQRGTTVTTASIAPFKSMLTVLGQLFTAYSAASLARQAFADAGTESRVTAGLTALTGSAKTAATMIGQLHEVSSTSQFGLPQLEESARLLTAMGVSAGQVVPQISTIATYLQNVGGTENSLQPIVNSLARMTDEGRLSAQSLRSLESAGVDAGRLLADAFGTNLAHVMQLARSGTIDAATAVQVLITQMSKANLAVGQTNQSSYALFNTLKNNLSVAFMELAEQAIKTFRVNDVMQSMIGGIRSLTTALPMASAAFRELALIGEILLSLKLAGMFLEMGTSVTGLVTILLVLVELDLSGWAARSKSSLGEFLTTLHEAVSMLNIIRKGVGEGLGDMFSGQPVKGIDLNQLGRAMDRANNPAMFFNAEHPNGQGTSLGSVLGIDKINQFLESSLDIGGFQKRFLQQLSDARATASALTPTDASSAMRTPQFYTQAMTDLQNSINTVGLDDAAKKVADMESKLKATGLDWKTINILVGQYRDSVTRFEFLNTISDMAKSTGDALAGALNRWISGTQSAGQAARAFLQQLEAIATQAMITASVEKLVGSLTNSLSSYLGSSIGGGSTSIPSGYGIGAEGPITASAMGNAFWGGSLMKFASGGIVNGPTLFNLRGGSVGLMGEAGPEAIIPLSRGADGRLGIKGTSGGVVNNYTTHVHMTINTPNADSFRRSQTQIMRAMGDFNRRGA